MQIANHEFQTLIAMIQTAKNGRDAKQLLEMWLTQNICPEVYKEGWRDACHEYDIKDDRFTDDDD